MSRCYLIALSINLISFLTCDLTIAFDDLQGTQKFINTFCIDCHDSNSKEAELDLSTLGSDLQDPQTMATWIRIFDRVEDGEMPPQEATLPTRVDRTHFLETLSKPLIAAHQAEKGTVLRRLNAVEYEQTINDIFGTNLRLAEMLPPDGRSHEFENVGSSLSMSMVQLRQYIEAMNLVLDSSIAQTVNAPEPTHIQTNYDKTSEGERFIGDKWLKAKDGAIVFFQDFGYPTGMIRTAGTRTAGWYKIRVHGYAYQSNKPVTFSIGGTTFRRGFERPTFGYFEFPPGKPTTVELTTWIEERYMLEITPYGIYDEKYEIKNNGVKNYKGPGLAISSVEIEGPIIEQFPSRGHRLLFDGIARKEIEPRNPRDKEKSWYKPSFEIVSRNSQRDAEKVLLRVAERAFRRPVTANEVKPYLALFSSEIRKDSTFEDALRTAVTAIFCSPDFLYLRESIGELDDYAIASRLSYFLNRTLPDEQLLAVAASGKLKSNESIRRSESERLLNSEHFERFVNDFTDAWLNLREIEFTTPDRNLFPEYDKFLLMSMLEESRAYFKEQVQQNLPVETIVKSDFAMLNSRLAELYGIEGVDSPEIRKVKLIGEHIRGPYLTQASVLKVSSNGTNTSPVVRGVWVLERIMGKLAPPPPPGVPGVEPDIRGATTLRELLDKHRDSETCRTCHEMIDPPGFALENFNPIGAWRTNFRSLGEGEKVFDLVHGRRVQFRIGPKVDSTGQLKDGRKFEDIIQFQELLAGEEETLTHSFLTKLLTFATGREMGFSDRAEIEEMVQTSIQQNHGIRDMIHSVVQSEIFRHK